MALPIYLLNLFARRIGEFIDHWYIGGAREIAGRALEFLESLDRDFALKVTLRHFSEPLYGDRTVLGYFLGFVFRSFRVLVASLLYGVIMAVALVVYLGWAAAPIYIIYRGFF